MQGKVGDGRIRREEKRIKEEKRRQKRGKNERGWRREGDEEGKKG